jgi:hypothetical protein
MNSFSGTICHAHFIQDAITDEGLMKLLFNSAWLRRKIEADPDFPDEAGGPPPRFFIDHGMIHDRVTGKHVTTAPDDQTWNGQTITETCALLNSLARGI